MSGYFRLCQVRKDYVSLGHFRSGYLRLNQVI